MVRPSFWSFHNILPLLMARMHGKLFITLCLGVVQDLKAKLLCHGLLSCWDVGYQTIHDYIMLPATVILHHVLGQCFSHNTKKSSLEGLKKMENATLLCAFPFFHLPDFLTLFCAEWEGLAGYWQGCKRGKICFLTLTLWCLDISILSCHTQ